MGRLKYICVGACLLSTAGAILTGCQVYEKLTQDDQKKAYIAKAESLRDLAKLAENAHLEITNKGDLTPQDTHDLLLPDPLRARTLVERILQTATEEQLVHNPHSSLGYDLRDDLQQVVDTLPPVNDFLRGTDITTLDLDDQQTQVRIQLASQDAFPLQSNALAYASEKFEDRADQVYNRGKLAQGGTVLGYIVATGALTLFSIAALTGALLSSRTSDNKTDSDYKQSTKMQPFPEVGENRIAKYMDN